MKSITFSFFLCLTTSLFSQAEMSTDEMALHRIVQDMEEGWNAKSGEKWATHFADDHDYVVWNGMYLPHMNRQGNAQAHQGLYNGPYRNMDLDMKLDKIRFVKPDVALVHTLVNTSYDGAPHPTYPELLISMVMTKTDGNWEIVSFHNLNIEYDKLMRTENPAEEAKMAFAKENYPGWYR